MQWGGGQGAVTGRASAGKSVCNSPPIPPLFLIPPYYLRHHANRPPQLLLCHIPHILPIHAHGPSHLPSPPPIT